MFGYKELEVLLAQIEHDLTCAIEENCAEVSLEFHASGTSLPTYGFSKSKDIHKDTIVGSDK